MKVLLIIPAYNEEENILKVTQTINEYNKNANKQLDYIVINDGSKDNTEKILQENNINNFSINKNGYLESNKKDIQTEQEKQLKEMIDSNKLYIIDMSGKTYQRDYLTGEIVEYPFEDMDPYQIIEPYKIENSAILAITSNKENKLEQKEILDAILQNR